MSPRRLFHTARPGDDLLIRGAEVLDPGADLDEPHDILIRNGRIAELGEPGGLPASDQIDVVDAAGKHVFPGFVDPHVHLRTPGQEYKEDLDTGTAAAAAGGYCAVVAMPNTNPTVDNAAVLGSLIERAQREARVPVGFLASITRGLAGEELTEMAELRDLGAIGFTDDGKPLVSAGMLRKALQYQRLSGGVIALHEEDPALSMDGVMHEGAVSARLGLAGIPSLSESTMIARDGLSPSIENARVHFQHLSAAESVQALAAAKEMVHPPARISGEVSPHHLTLTDDLVRTLDSRFKMNPPLRAESRSPGACGGTAQRGDRVRGHRSRASCGAREGSAVRAGADGDHRAGDGVRRALHRAGARRRARAGHRDRADDRGCRAV